MKRTSLSRLIVLAVTLCAVEVSASRDVTLFLDGAAVEAQVGAKKGVAELILPAGAVSDSLRIAPLGGAKIISVKRSAAKPDQTREKELIRLADREDLLNDRLKALSVREDIFKSAAKSQSGKAPKKTKTNPEPLAGIRQGTDFAITQLESVYSARRKTMKELEQVAERKKVLSASDPRGGGVISVRLTPADGSVKFSWSQTDRFWIPAYKLSVNGGKGELTLLSDIAESKNERVKIALQRGSERRVTPDGRGVVIVSLELNRVEPGKGGTEGFRAQVDGDLPLPKGEVSCFSNGVYIGTAMFGGVEVGKQNWIECGSR